MLGSFVAALALALGLPAAGTVESRQTLLPATVTVTSYPSAHGSLYGIARNLCGNGDRWKEIATANHVTWLIYPGQRLKVPCAKGAASSRVTTAAKPATAASGWVAPLAGSFCVVSGWGAPRAGHTHKGIDLVRRNIANDPIRAAHAGTVKTATWNDGAGWYVMLNHGNGVHTVYMHLVRRSSVRPGQSVKAGQTIGYVGSTGHSSGPHLHFEVHKGAWRQVSPAPFLRQHGVRVAGC